MDKLNNFSVEVLTLLVSVLKLTKEQFYKIIESLTPAKLLELMFFNSLSLEEQNIILFDKTDEQKVQETKEMVDCTKILFQMFPEREQYWLKEYSHAVKACKTLQKSVQETLEFLLDNLSVIALVAQDKDPDYFANMPVNIHILKKYMDLIERGENDIIGEVKRILES
jgi:hypothetical protein